MDYDIKMRWEMGYILKKEDVCDCLIEDQVTGALHTSSSACVGNIYRTEDTYKCMGMLHRPRHVATILMGKMGLP